MDEREFGEGLFDHYSMDWDSLEAVEIKPWVIAIQNIARPLVDAGWSFTGSLAEITS
jgi:hypothetical protein